MVFMPVSLFIEMLLAFAWQPADLAGKGQDNSYWRRIEQ